MSTMTKNCMYCGKKIQNDRNFCSLDCKKNYWDAFVRLSFSDVWVKRLYLKAKDAIEMYEELKDFSSRHNVSFYYVKNNVTKIAKKMGFYSKKNK